MSLARVPPSDQGFDRNELAGSTRALAKRARGLMAASDARGLGPAYRTYVEDAATLLEAAADVVNDPTLRPPTLKSIRTERLDVLEPDNPVAKKIAGSMASAMFGSPAAAPGKPEAPPPPDAQDRTCLRGTTAVTSIPDLIGFLGTLGSSGTLWVNGQAETFTIVLENGFLVHASSNHSPEGLRLGDVLIALGFVTQAQLDQFLSRFRVDTGKIGLAMEKAKLVTREQLTAALEHQVQHLFRRLFAVGEATFMFLPRAVKGPETRVRMQVPRLLLDSARHTDEDRRG